VDCGGFYVTDAQFNCRVPLGGKQTAHRQKGRCAVGNQFIEVYD